MTAETIPQNRRIYLKFSDEGAGRVGLELSPLPLPMEDALAAVLLRGEMMCEHPLKMKLLSAVAPAATALADITITQTATAAIAAGVRTVTVAAPGVKAGDALVALPTATVPAGYLVGQAFASAADKVKISLLAPMLAIGARYSIPCRLIRLNV